MNKTIKTKLISLFAVLLSICMLFSVASMVTTTAKAEGTTTAATLVEGAAVRVNSAESSGLKFKASIDKAQYNALYNQAGGKLKAGMIIVPTDYITAANGYTFNAFAAAGKTVASNTIAEFKNASESTYEFTMSIINLKLANYDRDFEAIVYLESEVALDGFVAYGDKYYAYAERNESYARNIYEVAKGVYNDRADAQDDVKYIYPVDGKYATLDTDGLAIAKTFIDGVTEIVLDNGKPAAYSSEYYAAKDSVLTNDTEAYLLGEHKNVVYKGESISSYPFTADGIAIKQMYTARATYANGEYTTAGYAIGALLWSAGNAGNGTYGYVAFDGEYGPSTYVEFTFTGNNMPNVILYADDVTDGNMTHNSGGKGIAMINGISYDGTASTGRTTDLEVWAPYRWNGHYVGYNSYRYYGDSKVPMMKYFINNPTTEFRYVVGTYIVKEDVHNASGVVYGAEEEKDGVLEEVIYLDMAIYNNSTGASLYTLKTPLWAKNTTSSTATTDRVTTEDLSSGAIMAFSALKGADATTGDVLNTTFKVTKAPYHVHNFNSEIKSDATHHWYECACGEVGEKAEHLGGTATHTEKAKCEVCGTAYGDLKPAWEVDDVALVQMTNQSAAQVITADKGTITFTGSQETPSQTNASSIVLKKQYTTEFVRVGFTALADYVREGTVTNLNSVLGLNVEYRTSSETSKSGVDSWGFDIMNTTNYFRLYPVHSGHYGGYASDRTVAKAFVAGEQYYLIAGIDSNNTLYFYILDEDNTVMAKSTMDEAALIAAGTHATNKTLDYSMPESGYWTINSWATSERTLSWETISETQAMYYINGGKGVEGLAVSGNTASWTAYNGATSYKVKVDNGEWTDVGNVTSYAIANLAAFDTYSVTVKAVCSGFETKETATQFTYVPSGITLANVDSIKADGNATATSGKVTVTADTASAIGFAADATDFIKVKFAATGAAVEAMSINFRQASVAANWQSGWGIVPNGTHGMMLNYGGNNYMNRINSYGLYTSVIGGNGIEAKSDFTEGNEYAYMFGITGTGTDKVLHFMIIDETNAVVMRYVTWTWAQISEYRDTAFSGWTLVDIAESGSFVFNFTGAVNDMTISYEIIEAADVFKNANYGAIANVAANGATVSWDAVANATNYLVSVNGGAYETVNTNSYTIANPVSFANYEVEIKANMGYYAATGSLNFVYTPAGVKLVNIDTIAANGAVSATSGSVTFADKGTGTQNSSTIAVKAENATDFLKVKFTALSTPVRGGLQAATALWFGLRRTEAQITINGNEANSWNAGPRTDTNDFCAYYGSNVSYFHATGNTKEMPTWYWNGGITEGDTCYYLIGVTSEGEIKLVLVNETTNKLLCRGTVGADNATNLAADGYFTIHSFSNAERTLSWEIVSEASVADYLG
ncbi:MAG: hypothetical protein IJC72_00420 [Clostridia bacterium]|nr:hypothetical protein [Clostridia bacterium]